MLARGFTLIELLVALLVLGILLQGGVYFGQTLVPAIRLTADTQQVLVLLSQARQQALMHQPIMVCASNSDCSTFGEHSTDLALIADLNHNARRDQGDRLIGRTHLHQGAQISWHSFRNQPNLTYRQGGLAYFQNGHILLCGNHDAQKIVVNWIGRPHVENVSHFESRCGNR